MSRFVKIDEPAADPRMEFFLELLPREMVNEKGNHVIGAIDDAGYPEGVLVFRFYEYIVDILYVEVYPDLRRKGIATALIRVLTEYLMSAQTPFMIETEYLVGDDNGVGMSADAFIRSLPDFEVVSGGKYCMVSSQTVWNSKRLQLLANFNCSVKSYIELTPQEKNSFLHYLRDKKIRLFSLEDEEEIIPQLSLCHIENGQCVTCTIFRKSSIRRCLEWSFVMSVPGHEDNLSGVLNIVIQRIRTLYPKHNIIFSLVNKESELLGKRFFSRELQVNEIYTAVSFGITLP